MTIENLKQISKHLIKTQFNIELIDPGSQVTDIYLTSVNTISKNGDLVNENLGF